MEKKILKFVAYAAVVAVIVLGILTIRRLYDGFYATSHQDVNEVRDGF